MAASTTPFRAPRSASSSKEYVAVDTVIAEQQVLFNALLAMTSENGRLSVLTNDLEIIGQLNPNGIFRTDGTGKVTYANKEWFRITGLSGLGDECDHWLDLVDDRDRDAVRADWEDALQAPWSSFSREFRFRRASATIVVWINGKSLAEAEPARSLADDVLGAPLAAAVRAIPSRAVIGAFTDVTHWREKEQQEIAALTEKADTQKLRAEDAEAHRLEQERFVDVICHEIRNPLNGIVNNVDQLHEGRRALRELVVSVTDGPQRQAILKILDDEDGMLSAIDLCAYHQRRITDDILQISRLRLGRYMLEEQDFWVDELVSGTVRMFASEARSTHVQLDYTPQIQRSHLRGDAQRISQILVNVLANAIKFTRRVQNRRVRVVATVVPGVSAGLCTLLLSVHDTGIGMTTEEQAKLFLPFAQANSKTFTTYGGSGMGLFITKELLGLMGGAVRVQSVPDLGTTFTLEIPVRTAASPSECADRQLEALAAQSKLVHRHDVVPAHEPAYTAPAAPAWPTRQFNILVVDDNDINRTVLVRHLNTVPGHPFDVIVAGNGEEAVEMVANDDGVDLVFMDIEMPVMDGLEAARCIRAREAASTTGRPAVTIVGLSGNARPEHVQLALESGMNDYIIKPYNRAGLLSVIERLLFISLRSATV